MNDTLFVPIVCPKCQRTSAMEFAIEDLRPHLMDRSPITLRCSYDEAAWQAAPEDRSRMLKLLRENVRVSRSSWLRLEDHRAQGANREAFTSSTAPPAPMAP